MAREFDLPKGPQGQKRPADAIGLAVHIGQIATGEVEEDCECGQARGGKARAKKLSAKRRSAIAQKAAQARWQKGLECSDHTEPGS